MLRITDTKSLERIINTNLRETGGICCESREVIGYLNGRLVEIRVSVEEEDLWQVEDGEIDLESLPLQPLSGEGE